MFQCVKLGDIEEIYEERKIEWRISNFFSINRGVHIESPTFCFTDSSWFFELLLNLRVQPRTSIFYICTTESFKYSVKYNLGLKKHDGTVKELRKGIILAEGGIKLQIFLNPSDLLEQKCAMDLITFTCTLKRESTHSDQPSAPNKLELKKLIKLDTLSENFKDLIANKESCDITLHVQGNEYKAHRAVLIARSPVFAAMFLHETSEKQTGIVTIPDCDPDSFPDFLKFLYCGKLEEPSFVSALYLYETSDKYEVEELKTFCVEYLMENLSVENLCDVVILADKYEEGNLLYAAEDFFNRNATKIIETSQWDCLVKNNYHLSKRLLREMTSKIKVVD